MGSLKKSEVERKKAGQARASPDKEVVEFAKPRPTKPIKRFADGKPKPPKRLDTSKIDPDLVEAAADVAKLQKTERGKAKTESALLRKLKFMTKESEAAKHDEVVSGEEPPPLKLDMSDLFSNLKVDATAAKPEAKGWEGRQGQGGRGGRAGQDRNKELTMEQLAFLQKRQKLRRQVR